MFNIFEIGSVKNPVWVDAQHTAIQCTVTFPNQPQLPAAGMAFVAMASDPMPHGQKLWTDLNAGTYGEIAAYVAPVVTAPAAPSTATAATK